MKQEIIIEQLHLEGITPEDKSAGKHEGKVIFVDNAVPGDVVDVRVYTNKKSFAKGTAIHWHKRSEHRQEPFCKHFSICGGCKWQDINYTSQVNFKQQIVEQAFKHIGQLNFPEMKIVGADEVQFFRNKLQYSFANKEAVADPAFRNGIRFHDSNALGYHIARFFDKIINIEECWLQAAPSNEIKNTIRDYAIKHQLTYYDQRMHHGLLRNLTIRLTSLNELMVIMSFSDWNEEAKALMLMLKESFPQLTSLMYNINQKRNDSNEGLDFICYHGRPYIFEQLGNLKFKISAASFFQTNTAQAKKLYDITKEFAALSGHETVYDLYTGTGSIAQYVAADAKKVVGVEYVQSAIDDAHENAALNNISNCVFIAGDLAATFTDEFITRHGRPDVIITDPPRSGMHPKVIEQLIKLNAPRIVYVSCNPTTQARDLKELCAGETGYQIKKLQPIDLFPHTPHVECVALLEK